MLSEIYERLIKSITGNGSQQIKIEPSANVRLFSLLLTITYAGGTNTLAALMTALKEIRYKVGTRVVSRFSGTVLRDWLLLHGTQYDFNGLPNTGAQVSLPFSFEFFNDLMNDALAWDPSRLGGPITVEIDTTTNCTIIAYERVAENLGAQSAGIITLEVINPVAGGTLFYTGKELELRGRAIAFSVYPDSTNSNEITPCGLMLENDIFAHEDLTSAQNDESLERFGMTPSASGRTANIYDMVFVKNDMLSRGIDLPGHGKAKLKVQAAAAMAGTCSILIVRNE
jgi:hypothetical protein